MTRKTRHWLRIGTGALLLVLVSAGASALITHDALTPDGDKTQTVHKAAAARGDDIRWNQPAAKPGAQPVSYRQCDDANVVGYGLGALAGGLAGHQFGKGDGRDVATVGGAAAGALIGGQYIPTRGALCPKR